MLGLYLLYRGGAQFTDRARGVRSTKAIPWNPSDFVLGPSPLNFGEIA